MIQKHKYPRIFFPRTINEALDTISREPNAVYWAGGSSITHRNDEFPPVVISLAGIEELSRASRTEQSLDIGAMISLDKFASISHKLFPSGLTESISRISRWPIRCRATIGGNLARQEQMGDLIPLLQVLDAKVEIRFPKSNQTRARLQQYSIAGLNKKIFNQHALITRVNIPLKPWNFSQYIKILPNTDEKNAITFCAAAAIDKNIISDFRITYADISTLLPRDMELESAITGRRLPLSKKELLIIENAVNRITHPWKERPFERETAAELAKGFLIRAGTAGV